MNMVSFTWFHIKKNLKWAIKHSQQDGDKENQQENHTFILSFWAK